jgi:hypothetical protein
MRRFLGFALMSLSLLVSAGLQAALQKGMVEAGKVRGKVTLKDASGRSANLTTGATFREGHFVETGADSSAELILSNGATIVLSPETLLELKIFSQVASKLIVPGRYRELSEEPSPSVVQFDLHRGKITGEARKLNPSTQFTVKTPVGVTRVRGTVWTDEYIYDINTQLGTQTTTCIKGEIEVNDLEGNLPVPAVGGQQVIIVAPSQSPRNYLGDGNWDDNPPNTGGAQSRTTVGPAPQGSGNQAFQELAQNSTLPSDVTDQDRYPSGGGRPPRPNLPPPPPPPPAPSDPVDRIIEREVLENVSPSGPAN